jgi:hypothetical protein
VKRLELLLLLTACMFGGFAHAGDVQLIVGKVHRVIKNHIEVDAESSRTVIVAVDAATTYTNLKTKSSGRLQDLAPGDEIFIKAISKDRTNIAQEIKFIPAAARSNPTPQPKQP